MTKIKFTINLTLITLLSSCTAQPANYVSPLEFKDHSCKQIAKEMAYTSSQLTSSTAKNQTNAVLGTAIMAYGISRGYSFSQGHDEETERLKSKYDALHQASIEKDCD